MRWRVKPEKAEYPGPPNWTYGSLGGMMSGMPDERPMQEVRLILYRQGYLSRPLRLEWNSTAGL